MNLPNLISSLRIILVPLFVLSYIDGRIYTAVTLLLLCALSDMLDGMLARKLNMVTDLGKILDPVADKLIQAAMMLCIALELPQMWLLLILHVFRELVLSAMGLLVIKRTGQVCSAKWYGKLCTAFIYTEMPLMLLVQSMPNWLADGLLLCSAGLMLLCLLLYLMEYLQLLKSAQ